MTTGLTRSSGYRVWVLYNPTADAAFSLNRLPSRMYRRSTVIDL
jgi:hypothetical protein